MPTAIAAPPLSTRSTGLQTPVDDGLASDFAAISGIDFAALLLGQLPADPALNLATTVESSSKAPLTDTLATPLDPALLLASMGISGLAIAPAAQSTPRETTDRLAAGAGLPSLPEMGMALAATADSAQKPDLSGKQGSVELAVPVDEAAQRPQTALPALSGGETPAKLAGFGQKLADATQAQTDTAPTPLQATPQQLSNAAQLGNNLTASTRPGIETVRLDTPLKDQAWPAEFGQKVVWLANQDRQSAQITLNPPDLGPIELSLNVKNDQATAAFTSANSEVREAIELALPRLREMLAGVGVELGQTNVSAESFRQQAESNNGNQGNRSNRADAGDANAPGSGQLRGESMPGRNIQRGNGLVDTFA